MQIIKRSVCFPLLPLLFSSTKSAAAFSSISFSSRRRQLLLMSTPSRLKTIFRNMSSDNQESDDGEEECDIDAPPGFCSKFDDLGSPAFETENGNTATSSNANSNDTGENSSIPPPCIRLQATADACLQNISTAADVEERIRQVREEMAKSGRNCDLYERQWIPTTDEMDKMDEGSDSSSTINVMQFNTLAQGLSSALTEALPFGKSPEHKKNDKTGFGGFTEIPEPHVCLNYAQRQWRIIEVVTGSCYKEKDTPQSSACQFDLIAMEEVDRFGGFFQPVLRLFGYEGVFVAKNRAPGIDLGWYSDGCALFWRPYTFDLIEKERCSFQIGTQVYLLATLRHKETGRIMLVAVTHLKASKSEENELIRTQQATELVDALSKKSKGIASKIPGLSQDSIPILLLGDFNAEPAGEGQKAVKSILNRDEFPRLQSAYPLDLPFSTWKTRGSKTAKRVIDYVFHNGKETPAFICTDILDLPDERDMEPWGLPGFRYPSDHLALGARFRIGRMD